ncbi:MAG: hypothetical protein D6761_01840 [Candidatus Dadabacteria bacterium]|nr:MAG: hypothetical protein D6761_01840 [Candidatus Dadabacteria bacterium]
MRIAIAVLALLAGCARPSGQVQYGDTDSLLIEDVRIYPGAGSATVGPVTVVVEHGQIKAITTVVPRADSTRLNGRGRTLLPGLIDAHTHVAGSFASTWKPELPNAAANLERLLYAGITTVLDLGDPLSQLNDLRARVRRGELVGPDLYFSGPHFGPARGHPAAVVRLMLPWPLDWLVARAFSFQIETVEDVRAGLAAIERSGADVVKVTVDELPAGVPVLSEALLRETVAGAHRSGRRVFAHIGSVTDALHAIQAGVDVLAHSVYKHALTKGEVRQIAASGVTVISTVGVFDRTDELLNGRGVHSWTSLERELAAPETLHALAALPVETEIPAPMRRWLNVLAASRAAQVNNVVRLWAAGAPIAVGTDSAIAGWIPGASMHQELARLVDAGMPPWAVLQAATSGSAAALRRLDRGRIAPGYRADLVLVDGDPLREIRDTTQIVAVVRHGKLVHRNGPIY